MGGLIMEQYDITIKLLSDTMFGSGESIPEVIDNDIRYDECGLPYMNAKTLKGHIREQMEFVQYFNEKFKDIDIDHLMGESQHKEGNNGILRFSNVCLSEAIRQTIKKLIADHKVTSDEVLDALTITYSSTKINENGVAEDHSLRRERMIKANDTMIFHSMLYVDGQLTDHEKSFLEKSVSSLQHLGTHKSKGKGLVECKLKGSVSR